MKLLWNTNKNINSFWGNYHFLNSSSWIYSILNQIDYKKLDSVEQVNEKDDLIIIDSQLTAKKNFYLQLSKKCSSIYLIHLGDEGATEDTNSIYNNCTHVWRTFCLPYYYQSNKVTCIPIGYKSGLTYEIKDVFDREYLWSFMGTIHGASRYDLINKHKKLLPNFIKETKNFSSAESLSAEEYYKKLKESIFVLVPHGYLHPESYRLYEGLECGCIPIIENPHNFYDNFLPDNPLIKINLWNESIDIINDLNKNKKKLKKKFEEINNWWKHYKLNLQNRIKTKIHV